MSKQAKVEVIINDDQAKARLQDIQAELKQIRVLRDKAAAEGNVKGFNQLNNEMKKLTREANQMSRKVVDVQAVLNNIKGASIKELRDALRKANQELEKMARNDAGFARKKKDVAALDAALAKATGRAKTHASFMDRAAAGFNKYFTMATSLIATFTGVFFSAKEWIKGLAGMDDALANVMKTTGLTRKETRELYTEFRFLNTRTARKELLLLAEEAGRLGKKSKKDVMDFVEVGNMIKVALGDDLKGDAAEAIKEVGKLANIYKLGERYGTDFRDSMLMIGSAINEVSASSQAQAPFLIDILKRMGGIADQADISAQNVIGYASALDQLGQSQEVSGTAINKTIINMFKDTATYADVAKMSVDDFTQLLKTDANEAFLKFLEGLNGNNEGLTVMATKFDGLGLDGARAIQVLAALASNTGLVRQEQKLANTALVEATSLTNEYNIKNNNMAGNLEKIGRAFHAYFINSNINKALEGIVGYFAKWVNVPLEEKLRSEGREVAQLVGKLTDANTKTAERVGLLEQLRLISPDIVAGLDAEKLNYDQLSTNITLYNEELINRIVLEKLLADQQNISEKAKAKAVSTEELELDIYELIMEANSSIATSSGTIEEKISKTINYLITQGATIDEVNKKSAITINRAGVIIDKRSQEQRMLDEIIMSQSSRNRLLEQQNALENQSEPIEKRIAMYKEMIGLKKTAAATSTDSTVTSPDTDLLTPSLTEQERVAKFIEANKEKYSDFLKDGEHYLELLQKIGTELLSVTKVIDKTDLRPEEEIPEPFDGLDLMARALQAQKLALAQQHADGAISQAQYHQLLEEMEMAHLITIIELRKKLGYDTMAQEQALAEMRIKNNTVQSDDEINKQSAWRDASIDIAQSASDAIFAINADRINRELDLQLSKLEKQRAAELKNKNLTEAQKDAINEKYNKKAAAMQLEAWKKQKAADVISSIIKTALAVVNQLSGGDPLTALPRSIAAGVAGAAQTAVIVAQKAPQFRSGGYTKEDHSDDKEAGIVHTNEFVANAQAKKNPTVKPVLDIIDRAQKSGAIRSINLPEVIKASTYKAGGYTASTASDPDFQSFDLSKMNAAIARFDSIIIRLEENGIHGKWVYQDFKKMADKEANAIKRTR
jgi:TP901 family phage tail tape measure protein